MNFDLLGGLRVIESSAFIAAPLAGMTLAQFGADVIRIDMIGGGIDYARLPVMPEGRSLYWTGLNKGKRSIAIDIRSPQGRELVRALVTAPGENGGVLLTKLGGWVFDHYKAVNDIYTGYMIMFAICAVAYLAAWSVMKILVPRHKEITDL